MNKIYRHSSKYSIATIWEFFQLEKINLDPEYQRSSCVWNVDKQSFLIDSIFKNFPIPPIFFREHVDPESGKTKYDVIDGKQRLTSIIKFLKDEILIPQDSSDEGLGDSSLDGKKFSEIGDLRKVFWQYELQVEFIDNDDIYVIDKVFDRLNRNGEPLTPQELRKASYHSTATYKMLENISANHSIISFLKKLDSNRYEDVEFCSELCFTLLNNGVIDSNKKELDSLYQKYCINTPLTKETISLVTSKFERVSKCLTEISEGIDLYYLNAVSHLYAIWCLAWQCIEQNVTDKGDVRSKLSKFYQDVKSKKDDDIIKGYRDSMFQRTKSQGARRNRVNILLKYVGLKEMSSQGSTVVSDLQSDTVYYKDL